MKKIYLVPKTRCINFDLHDGILQTGSDFDTKDIPEAGTGEEFGARQDNTSGSLWDNEW